MSLPEFPATDPCLTRERAINMILVSIAMEELALSHVIEAESDKMKYAFDYLQKQNCCAAIDQILQINESATKLIEAVMETQLILKKKMESALNALPKPCPVPCPPCTVPNPGEDCCNDLHENCKHFAIFAAKTLKWCCGSALSLCKKSIRCVNIGLLPSTDTKILLPNCSRFSVKFKLELILLSPSIEPILIELRHFCHWKTFVAERYCASGAGNCITVSGSTIVNTPKNCSSTQLCIDLLSPCNVLVKSGQISIVKF